MNWQQNLTSLAGYINSR